MKKIILISILILILIFLVSNNNLNEAFANSENSEIVWDNKITTVDNVINKLREEWKKCGFNEFNLDPNDLSVIDSRKRLIELLPVTKLLTKLNYEQVRCYVNSIDPTNYLSISKTITLVPKVLRPRNIIMVNEWPKIWL